MQPPAGAGNVVTVFVAGPTENAALPGALIIMIPEPPDAPALGLIAGTHDPFPPAPPPVLTVPAVPVASPAPFPPEAPPPPDPPALEPPVV